VLRRAIFLAALGMTFPCSVHAQADSGANTLSSICTDRPTKSNYACTVDAGHFQYEADIMNESTLRLNGVTTNSWLAVNPTLKYGLRSSVDVEANFSPLEIIRTSGPSVGARTVTGVSDLYLRLKYEFLGSDSGDLQATLLPYVKAPTASAGIGNGAVEGGLIMPVNYKLTDTLTLTTVPEFDAYKDAAGTGRHLNTAQLLNLGASLPDNFTLYGEIWGDWNFDTAGTVREYSADTALSYGITPYLQIDAGLNFGLNRYTPATQAYIGVSQKF
jgi:Putative MetA-pathway of phenol degradation